MNKKIITEINRNKELMGLLSEDVHTTTINITLDSSLNDKASDIREGLEIQFSVDGEVKGTMKCGEEKSFKQSYFTITSRLDCDNSKLLMSVDAGSTVWSYGSDKRVVTTLTEDSILAMNKLGLLLNGSEPKNFKISLTLGEISEDPKLPLKITKSVPDDSSTEDNTQTSDETSSTEDKTDTPSIPQNWVDGIMNKGWLLMKGSHGQEGKIPNTKDAIKIVQTIVGAKPDGLFGPNTEKKVKEWQKSNNLKDDGKVGKKTLTKIMSLVLQRVGGIKRE